MFFRQILHEDLGCASYVIADGGEAAVVDPKWEGDDYVTLAEEHDFRIAHVLETHNHADHVSGRGRLRQATGAKIYVSERAGVEFEHTPLRDGDAVTLGDVVVTALETPGHRPEHLAYVVDDRARSDAPWLVLTGDSLFVGDVARPDLAVDPDEGARGLYRSVRRLLELDDFAEAWPGHVGGSLCGGAAMSQKPGTTIGFERRFNAVVRAEGEEDFVRRLTSHLAPQPPNFERIVELNRGPLLTEAAPIEPLAPARVKQLIEGGAVAVDGRDPVEFDAAHVPGAINVTITRSAVGTRAAWVIDPETEVILVGGSDDEARRLGRLLEAVGFRRLAGLLAGGVPAWRAAGFDVATIATVDASALADQLRRGDVVLVDVREADEWLEGHVPGSLHIPYHELREGPPAELRNGRRIAVACSAGNRSAIAASLLRRAGVDDVEHVSDGIPALVAEGIELEEG